MSSYFPTSINLYKSHLLHQRFPTFWVSSPGILFYKQCWSHVASKLSEIYHFGNFSGPTWTSFKSRWLGTSVLDHTVTRTRSLMHGHKIVPENFSRCSQKVPEKFPRSSRKVPEKFDVSCKSPLNKTSK